VTNPPCPVVPPPEVPLRGASPLAIGSRQAKAAGEGVPATGLGDEPAEAAGLAVPEAVELVHAAKTRTRAARNFFTARV
jgi:hypothetical protein